MRNSTNIKAAALFVALAGTTSWLSFTLLPSAGPSKMTASTIGTGSDGAERPYRPIPAMVVSYEDGYVGGAVDDGKGKTTYREPYDATVFIAAIVDGRPERARNGGYYGWNLDVPAACAARAKSSVGRRISVLARDNDDDDESGMNLDLPGTRRSVCAQ